MLILTDVIKKQIIEEGLKAYPRECCGFILSVADEQQLYPVPNDAGDWGEDFFILDASHWVEADSKGDILAIYHTHPITSSKPSEPDKEACKRSGVPWVVCSPKLAEFSIIYPDNVETSAPILGRSFVWGMWDCYGLVKDVYLQELNIELPNIDRGKLFGWETDPQWNVIEDNMHFAGFETISRKNPLQKYDAFLMAINSPFRKINHCGVLMEPDKNIFYHHLMGRLSEAAVYGGWFQQVTVKVVRHKDLQTNKV